MSEHGMETLSAFLDGEPVAPDELAEALGEDGGREALIDWVMLRATLKQDQSEPRVEWYRNMRATLTGRSVPWWTRTIPIPVAAALGLSILGGGLLSLSLWGQRDETAPLAVRVLRFEPGVDWHEGP